METIRGDGVYAACTTTIAASGAADDDATVAATPGLRLLGYCVTEDAAGAATANIKHGATGATGTVLVPLKLASGGRELIWFGPDGLDCAANGLSIDRATGTTTVYLYTKVAE